MKTRKITDLPIVTRIPDENEFICPVYLDNTDNCLRRIKIADLADEIKNIVTEGAVVRMEVTDTGVKFFIR